MTQFKALLFCWLFSSLALALDFPLSNLQPGQTGYALTAGAGNVIERFPVEVIALQRDVGAGFPLVLVKTSGPFIEQTGGVAAGMSGSPVYLPVDGEDALLGAIGYVFPSSDHSLALVTPIEVMRGAAPETLSYAPFNERAFVSLGEAVPVTTPVLMPGSGPRVAELLESIFGNRVTPFAAQVGAGALPLDESGYRLEPGSAVSVQLARGDVTLAGVGTVTDIEGDTVLAFGHPFLDAGAVDFALAPAFVSYIVPSDVVPFKLADSGQTLLGSVQQDRPAAITGTLGAAPDFLPVTLTFVNGLETSTKRFEVANDERYFAPLLAASALQIFDETVEQVGAGTVNLAWDIELSDGERLRVLEQVADPSDVGLAAARLAAGPLALLADNIFATPELARVSLNMRYDPDERYAELVEVVLEDEELAEGERAVIHLRLQPYRGDPVVRTLSLPVPEEAEGSFDVTVRGGAEPSPSEPGEDDAGDPILSYGELLVALRDNVQGSELLVEALVDGERERLERLSFPYLVLGEETVTVKLESDEDDSDETSAPDLPEDMPEETDPLEPGDRPDADELD